jgi:predicted dehydrogenase
MDTLPRGTRIAVMGAGLIGQRHVAIVEASDEARLHAIVDPAPEARAFALARNAPWVPDLAAMLAQAGRPDGIIIATPTAQHLEHGLAAIAAGLPALIEKPLTDSVASGERLVAAARAAGLPLLTGHHRRHNPMIRIAKEALDAGRIGRLVAVHAFFLLMKPDGYFETPWRRAPGAGPVLTNLIHDIDLLHHLCGPILEVHAFQSNAVRGFPVDETSVVTFRFASGALGSATISDTVVAPWSWEHTTGENPAYPRTGESCYHLAGTHGALELPQLDLWTNPGARGWFEPFDRARLPVVPQDPLANQVAHFVRVIRGEATPLVSGEDGLAAVRVALAVQQSARTGEAVRLAP